VSVKKLRSIPLHSTINHRPITLGGCRNIVVIYGWKVVAVVIFGKEEDGVGVRNGIDVVVEAVVVGPLSSGLLLRHRFVISSGDVSYAGR